MELVIDLGNTNQKLAVFSRGSLTEIRYHKLVGEDEIQEIFTRFPGINRAILSSVINHPASLESFLSAKCRLLVLNSLTPLPVKIGYTSPETLGKDRMAAAVAGYARFPGEPVLVVNAGTCITYEFVDETGCYRGGAISPGINMRFRALHTFTGKLPLEEMPPDTALIGSDTRGSIVSGVINGTLAEIRGICNEYRQNFPGIRIILSGGDMDYLVNRLNISTFAVPNLVIHGLHQILAFNVNELS